MTTARIIRLAEELVHSANARRISIVTAESLTGGALASSIVAVPGTSEVFRGGIVSYQTQVKRDVLGVDAALLSELGAVDARIAAEMAERARVVFAIDGEPASLAMATTGVAGPTQQDGHPVGEVYLAVATQAGTHVEHRLFHGSREQIREQAVADALQLGVEAIADCSISSE